MSIESLQCKLVRNMKEARKGMSFNTTCYIHHRINKHSDQSVLNDLLGRFPKPESSYWAICFSAKSLKSTPSAP